MRSPSQLLAALCLLSHASAQNDRKTAASNPVDTNTNSTSAPSSYQPTLPPWGGCVSDPEEKVERGKPTTICLTVGPGGNWNRLNPPVKYMRYSFRPLADEYSTFHIPNSYKNLVQREAKDYLLPNITVFSSTGTSLSFLRRWYDKKEEFIFPHLTAIIDVEDGEPKGIVWDDACIFCSKKLCSEDTYNFDGLSGPEIDLNEPSKGCYLTKEQCDAIVDQGGDGCDLTLYAVWTGTDVNGNVMSSSNSRFSAFQPKQIQDRWMENLQGISDSVTDAISETTNTFTDTLSNAKDTVTDTVSGLNPLDND